MFLFPIGSNNVNKSISLESVFLEDLCGLVNLVLIMSNSSDPYIEHLVTPVFINCSNIDFKIEVLGGDNIETVTPGEINPFNETQFRITNEGSNQTNSDSTGTYSNNQIM